MVSPHFHQTPIFRAVLPLATGLAALLLSEAAAAPPEGIGLSSNLIAENSPAHSTVGDFTTIDPDPGQTFTYALVAGTGDTDNGRFLIQGGHLVTADIPDSETWGEAPEIRVRVTDSGGETFEQSFVLALPDDRTEDADGDGMTEATEEDVHGTSDTAYDTDGDGFGDPYEIAKGFLPANAASHPEGALVLAWGANAAGQTDVPENLGDVISIAAGAAHSLALRADGTVVAWGDNTDGQCDVPPGLSGVVAIGAGDRHSLAIIANGVVVGWGANDSGQATPPVGIENVVAVAGGSRHTIALRSDGRLSLWGANDFSQSTLPAPFADVVGIAAARDQNIVVFASGSVFGWGRNDWDQSITPPGLSLVSMGATGEKHMLMLRRDGVVGGWGSGPEGQLTPPPELNDAITIASRGRHNLAIRANLTVGAWGADDFGQSTTPFEARKARAIAAGTDHSLVLRRNDGFPEITSQAKINGSVGAPISHQLVVSHAIASSFSSMPLPAGLVLNPSTGLLSGTLQNDQRRSFRVFARTDRGMLTQLVHLTLGDEQPPTGIEMSPSSVMENAPAGSVVATLAAIDPDPIPNHVFQLVQGAGSTDNYRFQIVGNQLISRFKLDVDFEKNPAPFPIRIRAIDSAGSAVEVPFLVGMFDDRTEDNDGDGLSESHEEDTLGTSDQDFDSDGDGIGDGIEVAAGKSPADPDDFPDYPLIAWGANAGRELQPPFSTGVLGLSLGHGIGFARGIGWQLKNWGSSNGWGQHDIPAGLDDVAAISAGGNAWEEDSAFALALRTDGTVVAWGYNFFGQATPPTGLSDVADVSAGRDHSLALKHDGTVVAWGANFYHQTMVPSGLSDVVAISAGGYQNLALKGDGTVVGWGSYFNGDSWQDTAVPVSLTDVIAVSTGRFHCLALRRDGTVVAWGNGEAGQTTVPAGLSNVVAIAAGGFHSMALKADGSVVTWGLNTDHQGVTPGPAMSGIRLIAAGLTQSIAIRDPDLPEIDGDREIGTVLGASMGHQVTVSNATPFAYSATGLPEGTSIDPDTGWISGHVSIPLDDVVRVDVDTDKGRLTRYFILVTMPGQSPVSISLSPPAVMENSNPGTTVGVLSASDPDDGDVHVFELAPGAGDTDNFRFRITGNLLIVEVFIDRDFEAGPPPFSIRVKATDVAGNPFEQSLSVAISNDFSEDPDGNGQTEAYEGLIAWAQAAGLAGDDRLPGATPKGDGVTNLTKYAFGLNPGVPFGSALSNAAGFPKLERTPTGWMFQYHRRKSGGLAYKPRCSTSLSAESFVPLETVPSIISIDPEWERVVFELPPGHIMFYTVNIVIP